MRSVLAGDVEQIREAMRGNQRCLRTALLEQGVGADGHAVGEALDLGRLSFGALERQRHRGEYAIGLGAWRGRRLCRMQAAAVEDDGVGERSADVDSKQHAATLLPRR
jgi:hypothetical protein